MEQFEIDETMAVLMAMWPGAHWQPPTVAIWRKSLTEVASYDAAILALNLLFKTEERAPSFAKFREVYNSQLRNIQDDERERHAIGPGSDPRTSKEQARANIVRIQEMLKRVGTKV